MTFNDHAAALRAALAPGANILVAPGCYDALTASLVEKHGFSAAYVSGASIAYTRLGRPDIGLVTQSEVAEVVTYMRERVSLPLIVDADTGFGNALNLQRAVQALEHAGASAIQIEDQQFPKRCGHLAGKRLVPTAEMVGKVRAACDARRNPNTVLIARTDAVAVEGLEAAIERAERYLEAGADVLFIEALPSLESMSSTCAHFAGRARLLANMVEGGRTPLRNAAQLQQLGFAIAIFPGALVRAQTFAAQSMLAALARDGATDAVRDRMLDFGALNELLGTQALLAQGERYEEPTDGAQLAAASLTDALTTRAGCPHKKRQAPLTTPAPALTGRNRLLTIFSRPYNFSGGKERGPCRLGPISLNC